MIVHVSTSQTGGAGNAARRLHEGLLLQDVDSHFVSALGTPDSAKNLEILAKRYPRYWQRAARKFGFALSPQDRWDRTTVSLDCTNVFSSSVESDSMLLSHPSVRQASIINLHWVAGILPWKAFFPKVRCPIVWTLHDMNPFMGIFHYETDRQRGNPASRTLDATVREQKRGFLKSGVSPVIVAPSAWLLKQSQSSELFSGFRHEHIPYGLNTNVFKPYPQKFARSIFQLPTDRKLMLVVAERLSDHRKGFDLLLNALQMPELAKHWDLVAVGDGPLPIHNLKYHRVGTIVDERLMALVYSAADMTVIASREDNLPNVILESLCCGTPVIGTPAGGIPEAITTGRDGLIAESISSSALTSMIHAAITCSFDRECIAAAAAAKYGHSVQAHRYHALYAELVEP